MNSGVELTAPGGRSVGLWHYVWKLLRLRLVLFFSGFRRAKTVRKIGTIIIVVLLVGLAALAFWLSWLLLSLLRSPMVAQYINPQALINSFPSLIVTAAFLTIFMTSFGVLLQALYLSRDMDFLLASPLPMRAVFITKLFQAILPNFGLVCLFGLPVLFGLGASGGFNFLYYPLVVLALALLTLAAGGLSSLLVMAVVRVVPARRVAEVLGFLGATIGIFASQAGNLFSHIRISNSQMTSSINQLVKVDALWSPLAWVGRAIIAVGEGRWLEGGILAVVSLGLAGAIFWIALTTAERLYYTGWASMQAQAQRKRIPKVVGRPTAAAQQSAIVRIIPAQVRGLLVKDFLILRRDLRNLSQFISPLLIGIVFIFTLARGGAGGFAGDSKIFTQFGTNARVYISVTLSLFAGLSLMFSLALSAFSREGKNYWVIKTAPVGVTHLVSAKYLVVLIPSVLMDWLLMIIATLIYHFSPVMLIYGMAVMALSLAGAVGINLSFGVMGARLDWQDVRQMNSASVGCLGTLFGFIYLGLSVVFFFGPPVLFTVLGLGETPGLWTGLGVGAVLGLLGAILPLSLVRKRVERIGLG